MSPFPESPPPSEPPAIRVEGLECAYGGTTVLKDVSFTVQKGEVFFIVGGSGCGKSTLLRHMVGLHEPVNGNVHFFGRPFTGADSRGRRELLKNFGVLFQGGALWTSLTLRENVALPLEEYSGLSRREVNQLATLRLEQVGLGGFEDYYPAEISGGMKKRAALARAIALDPDIVFFDEPSAGLDPITARKLDELARHIRETFGTTLVIVSHDLDSIDRIADRVIMLDGAAKGAIAEGRPSELAGSSDIRVSEFFRRGQT